MSMGNTWDTRARALDAAIRCSMDLKPSKVIKLAHMYDLYIREGREALTDEALTTADAEFPWDAQR